MYMSLLRMFLTKLGRLATQSKNSTSAVHPRVVHAVARPHAHRPDEARPHAHRPEELDRVEFGREMRHDNTTG